MKRFISLWILIGLAPGCLILPLPADDAPEIKKAQKKIKAGTSTREEVISILGPPDVTKDIFILYKKKEFRGGWLFLDFLGGGASNRSGTGGQGFMDLYFEFDNYGVLTDFRVDKYDKSLETLE